MTEAAVSMSTYFSSVVDMQRYYITQRIKENVPLRSRFGNEVTRFVYRLSTGLMVHDTQTGLRAFGGELIPKLLTISQ